MRQITVDKTFQNLVEEPFFYWKKEEDIPQAIGDFIKETSRNFLLHDQASSKYYCSSCLEVLDENFICSTCKQAYPKLSYPLKSKFVLQVDTMKKIKDSSFLVDYYVFDVVEGEVILYTIQQEIY